MEFDNLLKHDQLIVTHMQKQLADHFGIEAESVRMWSFNHADGTTGLNMAAGYPLVNFWVPVIEDGEERDMSYTVGCDNDEYAFRVDPPGNHWPAKLELTFLLPENEAAFTEWNDNYDVPAKRLELIAKYRKAGKYEAARVLEGSLKCEAYTSLSKGDKVRWEHNGKMFEGTFVKAYVYEARSYPQSEAGPMPMLRCKTATHSWRLTPEHVEAV